MHAADAELNSELTPDLHARSAAAIDLTDRDDDAGGNPVVNEPDPSPDPRGAAQSLPSARSRRALFGLAGAAFVSACTPAPGRPRGGTTTVPTTAVPTTAVPSTVAPTTAPPTTPPPAASPLSVALVVDKLTFGARPGLVAAVEARGVANWIEDQLQPQARNVPSAESRVAGYATLTNTNRQNHAVQDSPNGGDRLEGELDYATILRATFSERQLHELMSDFWTNHFNIWRHHSWMGFLKSRDNEQVVRANALGKFTDLLRASSRSPAMLNYLDNLPSDASQPGGVNENYARELLELHTLGIINGAKSYTEADVHGVAQIISGWSIEWGDVAGKFDFKFLPWQHDRAAVSIFGGAFTRPARAYGQGFDDGVRLIDFLARHPSTARYISWKLCRRFIGDDPPMSLVNSTAAVFTANDTAIAPTLRHIFASPEFAASGRAKVRKPFEQLVCWLRATNAQMGNDPIGDTSDTLRRTLEDMGQAIFERRSPDGYPDTAGFWVSSEGLLQRWSAAGRLTRNRLTDAAKADKITVNLTSLLPTPMPATVGGLVTALAQSLGSFTMPAADVSDLCTSLAITESAAATTLSGNAANLASAVGLILCHPLQQRR